MAPFLLVLIYLLAFPNTLHADGDAMAGTGDCPACPEDRTKEFEGLLSKEKEVRGGEGGEVVESGWLSTRRIGFYFCKLSSDPSVLRRVPLWNKT